MTMTRRTSSSNPYASLSTSIGGFWPINDASFGNRLDTSGNGNTLSDTATDIAKGSGNGPGSRDCGVLGTNLDGADAASLKMGVGAWSGQIWVYPTTLSLSGGTDYGIGSKDPNGGSAGWVLRMKGSGGALLFIVRQSSGSDCIRITTVTNLLTANAWNHVVFGIDGTNGFIAVNNGTRETQAQTGTGANETNHLFWGRDSAATFLGVGAANSRIALAGFWQKALSTTEQGQLYNSGNGLSLLNGTWS